MRRRSFLKLTALPLAPALASGRAAAQDGAPALTVVAGGLINPRGFAWDAEGALVVAEAGTGGDRVADAEVAPPTGPYRGGPTARVSRCVDGCPIPVADGFPSAVSAAGEPIGTADVAMLGDRLLALVGGGGVAHGNPDQPAGLYELTDGGATLLTDLGAALRDAAARDGAPPVDPDGFLYSMVPTPAGDGVWVAERSGRQILKVGLVDPFVARLVDLSAEEAVPTALAVDAEGSLHIGMFPVAPDAAGGAYVLKALGAANPLAPPETVWAGLTMVTGLAFGPDGALYATEFSAARDQAPFVVAGSGRVVRRSGPASAEEVLTGLNFPTATRFGPDGALYVSLPAVGADGGDGIVVRADLAAGEPIDAQAFDLAGPACATGDDAGDGQGSVVGAVPVAIVDFAFEPETVTVTVGTTVAWTNTGAVDHTTASAPGAGTTWDSGALAPGATYRVTFRDAGTYPYACALHPTMRGTIEVVPTGP